ncbi:MAG TPA: calcium/sodium antiporter [Desulfonatronum sp.]|nr:calcium/sodium antiporter [Desulfonatronum sp.]
MIPATMAVIFGLALLIWSANRFVDGAAATARHLGMPPLLIGMVIIGFGTSAPEMVISALASWQGSPGIALGNAYGSNIANIALILGLTALITPIAVHAQALRKELPLLLMLTGLAALQFRDGFLNRTEGWVLLGVFFALMGWTVLQGLRLRRDVLVGAREKASTGTAMPMPRALFWLVIGLMLLVAASRMLVWGAVEIAHGFGVSDLIIGLTIVAVGTSLPELASSLAATRKGQHDLVLGNVLGSNLFNTLAVVGIAGIVHPLAVPPEVLSRDVLFTAALTLGLFIFGLRLRGQGRINRAEGGLLLACYIGYTALLISTAIASAG